MTHLSNRGILFVVRQWSNCIGCEWHWWWCVNISFLQWIWHWLS